MKKIFSTLFKKDSDLAARYWQYRLVKVFAITIFVLSMVTGTIILMVNTPTQLLGTHNIRIISTLSTYTKNYSGKGYENTLPKFFELKGRFGVLDNNKISYIYTYSIYNSASFCLKYPIDNIDLVTSRVQRILTLDNPTRYISTQDLKESLWDGLIENQDRRCFFEPKIIKSFNMDGGKHFSESIINYRPNFIFYIEMLLLMVVLGTVSVLLLFTVASLIYWGPIKYIMHGKNRN